MTISLKTPTSININNNHLSQSECTFEIQCPDANLENPVVLNEAGGRVFTLTTKPFLTSWSVRRSLKDESGMHILDLRHYKSKLGQWEIQDPQEKQLCLIKDGQLPGDKMTNLTAQLHTGKVYATISLKSADLAGTTTIFEVENVPFAELTLTSSNDVSFLKSRGLMRSTWKLHVATGVDLALVLALTFCRIELNHMFRR